MTCGLINKLRFAVHLSQSSAPSPEESVLFLRKFVENVEACPIASGPISRALTAKQRSVSPSEARVNKKVSVTAKVNHALAAAVASNTPANEKKRAVVVGGGRACRR